MKKNVVFTGFLSLLFYLPIQSIAMGGSELRNSNGQTVLLIGEMHTPPINPVSEKGGIIAKQQRDVIDYVKDKKDGRVLVEGMTPTEKEMRQQMLGGDGICFMADLLSVAQVSEVSADNIEWREKSAVLVYCAGQSTQSLKEDLQLAFAEMKTHAEKYKRDDYLHELSDFEKKYVGSAEYDEISSHDLNALANIWDGLFNEGILQLIDEHKECSTLVICTGLKHTVDLRLLLQDKGYTELKSAGELPDSIVGESPDLLTMQKEQQRLFMKFNSVDTAPLDISVFINK